ncbi:MAG: hypothetical protein DWQ19_12280 [Crenarchaeota archaeon]|nr:MAG: hypothetical protein DWQ19_12280 [Thermoproteota archaeon]
MNSSSNNDLYFCLRLTADEHSIVEDQLRDKCWELGLKMEYYRQLKDGHIPTLRETKITGKEIGRMKGYLAELQLEANIVANPHRENKKG